MRRRSSRSLTRPSLRTPPRYFTDEQVADAEAIKRLRFLELALDEIGEILDADDPSLPDNDGMVELEIGWPVGTAFPGEGRVELTTLPACTVLSYLHRGHYQELDRSYRALEGFVEREGLTTDGAPREIYETSPEEVKGPAEWLTEIQFPIVRDEARIAAFASL